MGLATIDPHSNKLQTKLNKILKFGVNRPKIKVSKTQPFENVKIYKEMYGIRTMSDTASGCRTFLC